MPLTTVWSPFTADRMPVPVPVHRFTVKQYHEMIRTGILGENDRVELLAGLIVDKMPQHPIHAGTVSVLKRELDDRLPAFVDAHVPQRQPDRRFEESRPRAVHDRRPPARVAHRTSVT